ncbi:Ger(x)C family spore germination protein [Clostridium sp. SHJSY1]|uniref:Ger(x)C family spore germination protein n=1 Tax=Clostridium sp. SHJSY1 TaxID=2942483 RepID=UPI0028759C49|nr:Ger(x)C family spore germination protein [Clostridium sp. SHJSY1]MDS0525573.1 Ger(x)C family spore germination protein [Clostridium sp. SHJSY1]
MKRRVVSLLFVLILSLNLGGCFNYTEINKITFATSMVFDVDELNNVVIYLDCVRPYRNANESSDKGKKILFQGKGKTILEAIRDMDVSSSNKINLSQVRAYIFTEKLARKGIKNYIDLINNNQQLSFKPHMFVFYGDIDSLLKVSDTDEEYLGLYLDDLVNKNEGNGRVIKSNFKDYLVNGLMGDNISFMSALQIKKNEVDSKIELNGGVVMKDNHMIDKLEQKDALTYNLLMRNVNKGTLEVPNPEERDKLITLDILEETNNTGMIFDGKDIILEKSLNIKVSLGEIQGKLIVNKEMIDKIKINEEWKIKNYQETLFKNYQEKNIDIFGVSRLLEEKYPNMKMDDILSRTKLETKVNIVIDGSSLVKNSFK